MFPIANKTDFRFKYLPIFHGNKNQCDVCVILTGKQQHFLKLTQIGGHSWVGGGHGNCRGIQIPMLPSQ